MASELKRRLAQQSFAKSHLGGGDACSAANSDHRSRRCDWLFADGAVYQSRAEVQRPLATVVVGGIVSSTLLMLFVLPPVAAPIV